MQLTPTIYPPSSVVSWTSSNTALATVSAVGLVTAVDNGVGTVISLTTADGRSANTTVTTVVGVTSVSIVQLRLEREGRERERRKREKREKGEKTKRLFSSSFLSKKTSKNNYTHSNNSTILDPNQQLTLDAVVLPANAANKAIT